MKSDRSAPHAWALALLSWSAPPGEADAQVGDLVEEYHEGAEHDPARAARTL